MDLLLWALLTIGALVVVGSYFLVRKLPRDIRPVAIVPLVVVFVGFIIGASLGDALGGAILFALIAGFACVIYTLDNRER